MNYVDIIERSLRNLGEELARDMDAKGLTDTGQAKEFEINITGNKIQLLAVNYIDFLIDGRGPGKFPPVDKIREYVDRNGITMTINDRQLTPNQVAYMIGKSIAEKGTRIYRGEKEGLDFERIFEDWQRDELFKEIEEEAVKDVKTRLNI